MPTTGDLDFEAPGPGSWELDRTHWSRPVTRLFASLYCEPFTRGFSESARRYGLLILCPRVELVHGFVYTRIDPAPEREVPERFGNAARVFEAKLWREDVLHWDQEDKPASIRAHQALQRIDPLALDPASLLEHVDRCRAHLQRMVEQHQRYIAAALVPTGDFLAQGAELADVAPQALLTLLRGSSPVSSGSEDGLDALATAVRSDDEASAIVASRAPASQSIRMLLASDGEVAARTRAYLDMVECRLIDGFDMSYPCGFEMPAILIEAIRGATRRSVAPTDDHDLRRIRQRVPLGQRPLFDELLREALSTYRLRDERSIYSDIWALGLMRRAVLVAGARLADAGRLEDPEHLLEACFEDVVSLLRCGAGPSAAELAARARFRATHDSNDARPVLGDAPAPPPSLDGLPEPVRRVMRAVGVCLQLVFSECEAASNARIVRGLAASPGIYEGTARLLTGPQELARIERGDVLVTRTTSEAFNIVLPLVGAIVTDAGGLLSHAAIVAREYGIPSVVGTRVATQRIAHGARVRVDGSAGSVELLS